MTQLVLKEPKILVKRSFLCTVRHRETETSVVRASGAVGLLLKGLDCRYCKECKKLLLYVASKRFLCPSPKPTCRKCSTHPYGQEFREMIREVMRSSGKYLILHGRAGLMKKYLP